MSFFHVIRKRFTGFTSHSPTPLSFRLMAGGMSSGFRNCLNVGSTMPRSRQRAAVLLMTSGCSRLMILDMTRKSYEETLQKGIAEKFLLRNVPRSRERERMSAGQVRVVGRNKLLWRSRMRCALESGERAGVRCRNGHAIPVFATAAHAAILVPMPTLEINPMLNRQTTLRNHVRRTRDLLLPRLLSGQVNLGKN